MWVAYRNPDGSYGDDLDAFVPRGAVVIPPGHEKREDAAKPRRELQAAAEFEAALEAGQMDLFGGEVVDP